MISCEHKISYKSDNSIVTLSIDSNIYNRGPGYFKLNNSLLLDGEYQQKIKDNINGIARINKDANPNTLWEEIIKGTIRNETIKYASLKKKRNIQIEDNNAKEIQQLEIELMSSDDPLQNERLKQEIDNKRKELETIMENKLNGYITRSKAQIIEQNEKNTKYFASLEKKKSESKVISRLNINGTIVTNQQFILSEEKPFYEKLYSENEQTRSMIDFFDNSLPELNEDERNSCGGLITEQECEKALKEMKNQKSPGSNGITAEFYILFWKE